MATPVSKATQASSRLSTYDRIGIMRNAESLLLRELFERPIGAPALRRIESQLMLLDAATAKVGR